MISPWLLMKDLRSVNEYSKCYHGSYVDVPPATTSVDYHECYAKSGPCRTPTHPSSGLDTSDVVVHSTCFSTSDDQVGDVCLVVSVGCDTDECGRDLDQNQWLETHIWHAKRMKMVNQWGYRLVRRSNHLGRREIDHIIPAGTPTHGKVTPTIVQSSQPYTLGS